jgi:drug/metabolite transporter (DMT)-like permease
MTARPNAAANRRGIAAMSLAMASFVTNDSLVKAVSESLPSAQLIFLRGLFATALLLAVAQTTGARPAPGCGHRPHRPCRHQ